MKEIDINNEEKKLQKKIESLTNQIDEIKKRKNKTEEEKPTEQKPLMQQLKELKEQVNKNEVVEKKKKKVRIPRKAKATRRKIKKGWIGIMLVNENSNVSMEKQKVDGFAYKANNGNYYTTDGREVLFWQGKYPFIIQPSWLNNPINVKDRLVKQTDSAGNIKYISNETYGDKYKMAKMLKDTIKVKDKKFGGNIILWIILGIVGVVVLNYAMGGKFF